MKTLFEKYAIDDYFDEMFSGSRRPRRHYRQLCERLAGLTTQEFEQEGRHADTVFLGRGITFTVYGGSEETERIFPFDLLPRIIPNSEWTMIETGLRQRVRALNLFLLDLYTTQHILRDGTLPRGLIESSLMYCPDFNHRKISLFILRALTSSGMGRGHILCLKIIYVRRQVSRMFLKIVLS